MAQAEEKQGIVGLMETHYLGTGAFDIDGTLVHHKEGKPDYLDAESLNLAICDPATCARVRTLIEVGMDIHFVTGRSHSVKQVTLEQLRRFIHPAIMPSRLHTQEEFKGYEAMTAWKAQVLSNVKAEWFVGDHEADERAAQAAGIPFQFAHDYADASKTTPWAVV